MNQHLRYHFEQFYLQHEKVTDHIKGEKYISKVNCKMAIDPSFSVDFQLESGSTSQSGEVATWDLS